MLITINAKGERIFNRSEVMKRAWVIYKYENCSFSEALKKSWEKAKSVMRSIIAVEEEKNEQERMFEEYKEKLNNAEKNEKTIEKIIDEALENGMESHYFTRLDEYACGLY